MSGDGSVQLKAVRGATLIAKDEKEAFIQPVKQLLEALLADNQIAPADIVNIFFTQTADLTTENPARVCRLTFDWTGTVPLFCMAEPDVTDLPERCIRVLIQFYGDRCVPVVPVYINGAEKLRPDLLTD